MASNFGPFIFLIILTLTQGRWTENKRIGLSSDHGHHVLIDSPPKINRHNPHSPIHLSIEPIHNSEPQISCLVHGHPLPKIHWVHNGKPFHNDSVRHHGPYEIESIIHFHKVEPYIQGNYTCSVSNKLGSDHLDYTVHIESAGEYVGKVTSGFFQVLFL